MPKTEKHVLGAATTRGRVVRQPASEKSDPELSKPSVTRAEARDRLVAARLRPTRPRIGLLRLLLAKGDPHVTPDDLWADVQASGIRLSMATLYNNLNAFTEAGLIKRIVVGPGQVFFETNTSHHHHVYYEEGGDLRSVPARQDGLVDLPDDLVQVEPQRLDIIVRVRATQAKEKGDAS